MWRKFFLEDFIYDKVNIICNEHGVFNQTPNDHINGKGCPKCGLKYNKLEQEIKDYISELGVLFYSNIKIRYNCFISLTFFFVKINFR